ncbi:hypothetical protein ACFY8Q_31650 [[Kitasatospora] papulosa]|uniref:hypothetical protein n=1 Tax=Streptomyces TaxID=1883 RepID=UPI00080576B5|nr:MULTISPECIES: hypothetical protein [unclassified Streptomyces]MYR74203.1 hypothetical protein [Streptomyces sp. SID4925]SBV01616.1 hypothetical protein YUMDRAFT_06497 [Streptomyces sp. OspMP-M45]
MVSSEESEVEPPRRPDPKPSGKAPKSEPKRPLIGDKAPFMEQAHWTLGAVYYGAHLLGWMWMQAQEQVAPVLQRYV